jgi:hypothetical protein
MILREWIIRNRCSWMAVYVFCRNAQSEPRSDPHDVCTLSLLYQLPNCNLFTQHVIIYLMEIPLVNYGPWSNFPYIVTPFTLLALFTFTCKLLSFYHSIRSILCLQQTDEIDNLIVSWELGEDMGNLQAQFPNAPACGPLLMKNRRC